jgi:adenylate kinase
MVDATKVPFLRIPPEFGTYAEEHGIFELFGAMLKELLVALPENPLEFLLKLLTKPIIDGM